MVGEKIRLNGYVEIPPRGLLDYLSRVDSLLMIVVRLLERQGLAPGAAVKTAAIPVTLVAPERYEIPISKIDRVATSSSQYVTLVSWELPTERHGELGSVDMDSDDFGTAIFKLEVAGKIVFENIQLSSSFSQQYPGVRLAPGSMVKLSVKSSDGTTVTAYGGIAGKEIPK